MKKIVFLFAAGFLTAISAKTFAQSTGTTPYPGATHAYSVALNTGSTYVWKIYDTSGNEVTATSADIASIVPNTAGDTLFITWATGATTNTEYLVTVTEEVTATTCSNTKALPIKITSSTFDLIVGVDGATKCYTGPVTIGWTGGQGATDVTYDHGDATIGCTVEAQGVGVSEAWGFSLDFAYTQSNIDTTDITVLDGSSNPVTPNASGVYTLVGPQTATVSIVVDNDNSYTNESSTNAQDFTATISLANISSGTGAIESDNTNNSGDQEVARPNTSGISTN